MNKDTLSEIFKFVDYRDLYSALQVNHLWRTASVNQLNISHQTNIILPIIHNRLIKDQFIQSLRDIFLDYIQKKSITFKKFLTNINEEYTYGYDDDEFIFMLNEANNSTYNRCLFDILYDDVMKKIERILFNIRNYSKPLSLIKKTYRAQNLFEQAFVIFMYLRKILTKAYDVNFIRNYEYIEWNMNINYNRVFYYGLPSTGM